MPTTDKNQSGGHSHPQESDGNDNDRGDSRKGAHDDGANKPGKGPKESFGSSGAKDSH